MTSKPWKLDVSAVPEDKLNDPRFIAERDSLQAALANDHWKRAFAIHEGAHLAYFPRIGRTNPTLESARIEYDPVLDKFNSYAGAIAFSGQDDSFLAKLSVDQWITGFAMACAAGGVAARMLVGAPGGGDEEDYERLCQICDELEKQNPKANIDRLKLWKGAQEEVRKELIRPDIQAVVRQAAEIIYRDYSEAS
jgi:hypothetical protein